MCSTVLKWPTSLRYGSDGQLLMVLRTLITSRNRNKILVAVDLRQDITLKSTQNILNWSRIVVANGRPRIQKALESDAQVLMDQFASQLLSSSLQRLKDRHRHLGTSGLEARDSPSKPSKVRRSEPKFNDVHHLFVSKR